VNYIQFYNETNTAEFTARNDLGPDFGEREVFVVDEEGFVHVVNGVQYDKESGAFWIRSRFRCDKE